MDNIHLKRNMSAEQLAMVESEVQRKKKSKVLLYIIWWFFGIFGVHRFYLGDIGYGILLLLTGGGLGVLWIIDLFIIGKRLEYKTVLLEREIVSKVIGTA